MFQNNFRSIVGPLGQKKQYFKLSINALDEILLTKLKLGYELDSVCSIVLLTEKASIESS